VPEDEDTSLDIFKPGNTVPSVKVLTLQRKATFDLEARYDASSSTLPGSVNPWLGKITVKGVTPTADGAPSTVKVKTRMNQHGIFNFESATLFETVEEPVSAGTDESAAQAEGAEPGAKPATKKTVNKKDLSVIIGSTSLDKSVLDTLRETEGDLHENDRLVADTEDRKNALEEYIYDTRDKLDGPYASYAVSSDKEKLRSLLESAESWLYTEEGETANKSAYVAKLDELKEIGGPIALRYKEAEDRPAAIKKLRESLSKFYGKATGTEERYAHISEEERQKAIERVALEEKWLNDQTARQAERAKSDVPSFTSTEVLKRREELVYFCNGIFNKPKPAPSKMNAPPPPSTSEQPQTEKADEEPTIEELDETKEATDSNAGQADAMDVD